MTSNFQKRFWITLGVAALMLVALGVATRDRSALAQDPAVGATEALDLTSWRARDGRTLADVMKQHSVAMFAVVDPNCATCTKAQDSLRDLRERVAKSKMEYFVLLIPADGNTSTYYSYADSLKLDAEAFVWSNSEAKPPTSVTALSTPGHLLVSSDGQIANKWAGIPANF